MLQNLKQLFEDNEGKRAIGAFNVHCLEMLPAMLEGAKDLEAPIILQTSLGTAEYIGFDLLVSSIETLVERLDVDVCLHMDHCKDIEALKKAIDSGYTSVMYDGSSLPLDENIKNTKFVVEYAHANDASVEGEVGTIGGAEEGVVVSEEDAIYTDPADAYKFVRETGVDAIAVAIGTTHGQYKSKAKINFELLEKLSSNLKGVGLVLHGGTGVSDEDMRRCVANGMKKVNVGTELNKSYIEEVNKTFSTATPLTSLRKLLLPANNRIKDIVMEKTELFQLK
ncbi:class II fructose-bisphosphate aldolase [Halalkalibacter sp. APA_J-10(15)]|uniref:class II fructose-bisphosphate aldolase n=1 Tax=Halalkalibacter sp. APA_J-10(15) TaxID=2933805 RepID=UPI001FF5F203|nr:class II fructose-bisphosphate aldolase [Halalkalibacter sp. APA_J-10(15)]MCK0470110.1 class II fructose-bisphosphate aldolase [Halalkalibacter sp. APA_J-10(15)]